MHGGLASISSDPCPIAALVFSASSPAAGVEEGGEATWLSGGGGVSAQGTFGVQDLPSSALVAEEGPGKGMGSTAS